MGGGGSGVEEGTRLLLKKFYMNVLILPESQRWDMELA